MKISDWYNNLAIDIWKKHGSKQKLIPLQVAEFKLDAELLIIGMNPSFNMRWIDKQLKSKLGLNALTCDLLFKWETNELDKRLECIKTFEANAQQDYKIYFKAFDQFTKDCNLKNWNHLDLFLMRETNQKEALKDVGYTNNKKMLNAFGESQIELFKLTIEKLNPKAIVILNATASTIISTHLTSKSVTKATYKNIPVFLAGMLSGQRAMDRYAKQRLIEEIKHEVAAFQ